MADLKFVNLLYYIFGERIVIYTNIYYNQIRQEHGITTIIIDLQKKIFKLHQANIVYIYIYIYTILYYIIFQINILVIDLYLEKNMLKLHRDKNGRFKIHKFTILYFWRTYSNIYIYKYLL